jgi:hypothetical protein
MKYLDNYSNVHCSFEELIGDCTAYSCYPICVISTLNRGLSEEANASGVVLRFFPIICAGVNINIAAIQITVFTMHLGGRSPRDLGVVQLNTCPS